MVIPIRMHGDEDKIQRFLELLREVHPHTKEEVTHDDSGVYKFTLNFNPTKTRAVIEEFFRAHDWRFCSCSIDESGVRCEC